MTFKKSFSQSTIIALFFILTITLYLRVDNLFVPLERDEGDYAYIAQRAKFGELPYRDIFHSRPPLIHSLYWVAFKIFGETELALHLFMNIWTLLTALALFILNKKIFSLRVGYLSALIFLIVSMGSSVNGQSANTEIFMILPITLMFSFLYTATGKNKARHFVYSGLCLSVALMLKPVALPFVLFALLLIALSISIENTSKKSIVLFSLGLIAPWLINILFYIYSGILQDYFDMFVWEFIYAQQISIIKSHEAILRTLLFMLINILKEYLLIFLLACFALSALRNSLSTHAALHRDNIIVSIYEHFKNYIYVVCWAIASIVAISAGWRFYAHYFILLTAPVAILSALGLNIILDNITKLRSKFNNILCGGILFVILTSPFILNYSYWAASPEEKSRIMYSSANPFPESRLIAQYIKQNTTESDSIFIIGAESTIYFLAGRKAASKYISVYPLTAEGQDASRRQRIAVDEIIRAQPKYIISVNSPTSILADQSTDTYFFKSLEQLINTKYVVDSYMFVAQKYQDTRFIIGKEEIEKRLNDKTILPSKKSSFVIKIYKKI